MKAPERLFGIIGYPLGHSFSRNYFNQKFEAEGIDARYDAFAIEDIGDLMEVIAENDRLVGLNVTIPYKQQVIPYLDALDQDAKAIGAVNVIKLIRGEKDNDFKLVGYNSDFIGFLNSIKPLLEPADKKALILGTGGASKAVQQALKQLGLEITLVSRTAGEGVITYADLTEEVMKEHRVIVNATPVGMYPNVDECPPIPYNLITPAHLCYDVIYNPDPTLFLKKAAEQGARVKNGTEMLLLQAYAAWEIWNRPGM
ncbi:MAG: shikimate dehydrogenase [Muribaculaceae bacterium]|nr:shikimate dehydrogenase [Muribaculaceae bacterium]